MTEPRPGLAVDGPPAAAGGRPAGFRTGWGLAGRVAVGLVAGAVTAGLLGGSAAPAAVPAEEPVDGGLLPDVDVPTSGTQFRVTPPCLRAVNAAQDASAAVEDLGEAAAALDAARLDEVVRRLQPLQVQLETDLAACEVTPVGDPAGEGPAPPTTPPATPTG